MPDALKICLQGVGQVGEGCGSNMITDDKEQQRLFLSITYKNDWVSGPCICEVAKPKAIEKGKGRMRDCRWCLFGDKTHPVPWASITCKGC